MHVGTTNASNYVAGSYIFFSFVCRRKVPTTNNIMYSKIPISQTSK